jgi:3-deoxy-D-manno-octulosonate 8-phosphate phosphatase (KDO 8-P phosphatase)
MLPKLIATDIDGVWTDGGMYYSESGDEWKKFNTADSAGVIFCRLSGIPVAIITGESSMAVKRRAEKLKVDHCYTGVADKAVVLKEICTQLNITPSEVAYVGDDLNDIGIIRMAGFSACPSSAPEYIKKMVSVVLKARGGEGAFREFVEHLLIKNELLEAILQKHFFHK